MTALHYENATCGKSALADMQKILRAFGTPSFGYVARAPRVDQGKLERICRRAVETGLSDSNAVLMRMKETKLLESGTLQ